MSDVLNDRYVDVYMMRVSGNTFGAIAKHFGINVSRVREMFLKAEKELGRAEETRKAWHYGLSERTRNLLQTGGYSSREEVERAIRSESELRNIPNLDEKTMGEIREWLDTDATTPEAPSDEEIESAIKLLEQNGYVVTKRI